MQRSSALERLVLVIVLVPLAATAYLGPHDAFHTWPRDITLGQRAVSSLQLAYGLSAALSFLSVLWRRRMAALPLVAWAVTLTCAGALATVVWGGGGLGVALSAGVAVALVSALVTWGGIAHARRGPREHP